MHHLDRSCVPVPVPLREPHAEKRYKDLTSKERRLIREALLQMQDGTCAYCERQLADPESEGHIEHLRCQSDNDTLTLDWSNLFFSCKDELCCGKYKDKCRRTDPGHPCYRVDHELLIDPCREDPESYLRFGSDGTVGARSGLTSAELRRAQETIRVFNLSDSPGLRKRRQEAVRPYQEAIECLLSAGAYDQALRYLNQVRAKLRGRAFSTAIKHFLDSVTPT